MYLSSLLLLCLQEESFIVSSFKLGVPDCSSDWRDNGVELSEHFKKVSLPCRSVKNSLDKLIFGKL